MSEIKVMTLMSIGQTVIIPSLESNKVYYYVCTLSSETMTAMHILSKSPDFTDVASTSRAIATCTVMSRKEVQEKLNLSDRLILKEEQ